MRSSSMGAPFGDMQELALQNRIVAICHQAGANGFGVLRIWEWTDLHVKEFVAGHCSYENRILLVAQGIDECVSVFLLADGSDLHHVTGARHCTGFDLGGRSRF